jgi:hypothetical protein
MKNKPSYIVQEITIGSRNTRGDLIQHIQLDDTIICEVWKKGKKICSRKTTTNRDITETLISLSKAVNGITLVYRRKIPTAKTNWLKYWKENNLD